MDSYPEDLLVGVFPLVFAVNAILPEENAAAKRTLFDKFLDAVAASLVDEDATGASAAVVDKRRSVSLFRPDDDDSSEDELDLTRSSPPVRRLNKTGSISTGLGFRRKVHFQAASGEAASVATSYAKSLGNGQDFFQRARILTVSTKYGFPPSTDPEGTSNLPYIISKAIKEKNVDQLHEIFAENPVDGILSAGWLEKHVNALPSVIVVVCTVSSSQTGQKDQDRHLFDTVEHLHYSLVPKRGCRIHIIGLIQDDASNEQADVWRTSISNKLLGEDEPPPVDPPFRVTLLRASSDLQSTDTGLPTSPALRALHHEVREASLSYYKNQIRRTRDKLATLMSIGVERGLYGPPVQLLPLAVRYCFKIAIFYEFQMKHDKSLHCMAESYKHLCRYYQYLLSASHSAESNDDDEAFMLAELPAEPEGSVEVSLKNDRSARWSSLIGSPPDDMLNQCRSVADWLNLKLLRTGFISKSEEGYLAASHQWREHSRIFCSARRSVGAESEPCLIWSYIARQRIVMSQLAERHPPHSIENFHRDNEEIASRCSAWRAYEAAAEAMLRLGREIDEAKPHLLAGIAQTQEAEQKGDSMRPRYVGGLNIDGSAPLFAMEASVNHREKGLELILRAIGLFEGELEKHKRGFYAEDEFSERSSSRTGARLYFLAGGLLLSMGRHEEAAAQLSKALKYSAGWRELELSVRRMLIECYEKHMPSQSENPESSQALASMILDSYFNAEMSSYDLRKALSHFATMTGGETLKWYHETFDEEDDSQPFSFTVCFPEKTHATAGDTVRASILVKSNLDYAVHVNSITLISLAGDLPVGLHDLMSATNASEGSAEGIIMQAKTSIVITTDIELPKDLSNIATDDSGNGGELLGVAGKGSFAKNAKPRTAGVTSAGGARLVSEEELEVGNSISQGWSLRYLGGKPLRCDGLRVVFYPVQAERSASSGERITFIELTVEKKKRKTAANIRRTPFEEENYIASAWSRPHNLPFSRGPCSLRVLGPQSDLVISNLSEAPTGGKAVEGTVNRVILKLQSGPLETCSDIRYKVSCFSVLLTPSGQTIRLVSDDELSNEADNSVDMKNAVYRTPVLVTEAQEGSHCTRMDYGYDLPPNWKVAGSGRDKNGEMTSTLKCGECDFLPLDFFRPAAKFQNSEKIGNEVGVEEGSLCKTDFYVTVTYRLERAIQGKPKRARRQVRKRPMRQTRRESIDEKTFHSHEENSLTEQPDSLDVDKSEEVSLEYSGSIVWTRALDASFDIGARKSHPSGSRHPSNAINVDQRSDRDSEFSLIDSESFTTRCTLTTDTAMENLKAQVQSIRFEGNDSTEGPLDVCLLSGNDKTCIFLAPEDQTCNLIAPGCNFTFAFTVRATLKDEFKKGGVTATFGSILVDWKPSPLFLPPEESFLTGYSTHGPLVLGSTTSMEFDCPACYVEAAPFDARILPVSNQPSVASPFEVSYQIRNKTSLHQLLSLSVVQPRLGTSDDFLLAGLVTSDVTLDPLESRTFSFTLVASRAGRLKLPDVTISSLRYQSFVVNDSQEEVFVFP